MAGEYDREQIYTAMRAADAAGDAEAVRALTAALQAGASREQILTQAQQNNIAVNESDLDANIASRDAGGQTSQFLPPEQPSTMQQLGTATQNTVAGLAQGAGGIIDLPLQVGNAVERGLNYAVSEGGASLLDMIGADGAANWFRQGSERVDQSLSNRQTLADYIERASPTPEGGEVPRFLSQLAGGAAIPLGPKTAPRPSIPQTAAPATGARQIVEAGEREGVRVMTSDVRPPRSFLARNAQTLGERIPYAGTGGPRADQNMERIDAVRNLARDFGVDMGEDMLEEVTDDLVATRGAALTGYTRQKDAIIDGIQGGVAAPRAIAAIDGQIARLRSIRDDGTFTPVIDELQGFRNVLANNPTLRQVEENRRLLGELFEDPNLARVRSAGQKAINAIYDPLRDDMGAFIRQNGGDAAHDSWRSANDNLAAMAGELDAKNFKNVLSNSETTPEAVEGLLFSKRPSDVRRLMGNLSGEGRARAQSAVIARAFRDAGGTAGDEALSPQRFATAVLDARKLGNSVGVVFEGADRSRIEGLARLIQATQRASVAGAAPPTGVQNAMATNGFVAGSVFGTAAIPVATAIGWAARIYESAPVRNMLIGLSRTKAGTPAESRMVERIEAALASQASINSGGVGQAANGNAMLSVAAREDEKQ